MADTIRNRATLQGLLADNVSGDTSPQDVRDFLVSVYNWVNRTVGGHIYYDEGNVGIGDFSGGNPLKLLHIGDGADAPDTATDGLYVTNDGSTAIVVRDSTNNVEGVLIAAASGIFLDAVTNSHLFFRTNGGNNRMQIANTGQVKIFGDSILIATLQSPAAGGAGTTGEIAWDTGYLYVCTSTNTWKRAALTGGY